MDDNEKSVQARIIEELVHYFGTGEAVTCSHAETTNEDVHIFCRWELSAQEETERRIGKHNIGEMFTNIGMAQAAALEYIKQIEKGECQEHNRTLLDFINKNRLKAVWESSFNLKDDRQFSCPVNCVTCNGDGHIVCGRCGGRGRITCSQCGGSCRVDCKSCYGIGSIYDVARRIRRTCNYCSGSGRETCRSCYGGHIDCGACYGQGQLVCNECNGTGYFTIIRMFVVSGVKKRCDIINSPKIADWIKSYIRGAAENPDNHLLPLDQTISIHPPGIEFKTDYPYELKAPGTLVATRATFLETDKQERRCELFGEKLHPLNLGMVGETASSDLAQQVLDNKADLEKLQSLLQQKIFGILLPLRNTDRSEIKNSYPFRINILRML